MAENQQLKPTKFSIKIQKKNLRVYERYKKLKGENPNDSNYRIYVTIADEEECTANNIRNIVIKMSEHEATT